VVVRRRTYTFGVDRNIRRTKKGVQRYARLEDALGQLKRRRDTSQIEGLFWRV